MKNRAYLLQAIAKFEPKMRKAFLDAMANVANNVKLNEVVEQLRIGNVEAAVQMIQTSPEQFVALEDNIREAYRTGFDATQSNIPRIVREGSVVVMTLNPRTDRIENWLKQKSGMLIRDITESTRQTIRQHLAYGVQNGINPRKTALQLLGQKDRNGNRVGGLINLTPNQWDHVNTYRQALEMGDYDNALGRALRNKRYDRMLASGKPLTAEQIDKITQSYANNYTKHRATTIAQQETRTAMAAARQETLQQTVDRGYLKEDEIRRYWITRRDSRVRDEHEKIPGMNRKGVALNEPFDTPTGRVFDAPDGVGCRCYTDVRVKVNK